MPFPSLAAHTLAGHSLAHPFGTGWNEGDPRLIYDEFTDPNNTSLPLHAISPVNNTGGSWRDALGTFIITGNAAKVATASGAGRAVALWDTGRATYSVRAKINVAAGARGLALKYVNEQNYVSAVISATTLILQKRVNDVGTSVISTAFTYVAGAELRADVGNTTYDIFYNGQQISTQKIITDAVFDNLTETGLFSSNDGGTQDDFTVYPFDNAPAVLTKDITYPSTIDALTLDARLVYPVNSASLPLLVVMHSFSTDYSQFDAATLARFATNYGRVFCLYPNMRGRGASQGSKDSGGREIQDIIDAINYVKTNYASHIDVTQIHIVGHSGGGGNALSCAARYPDLFNSVTACFGISDYGYDPVDGWYPNAIQDLKTVMDTQIGGNPSTVPDAYHARASVLAITNYNAGKLWLFADAEDPTVNVANSRRVAAALSAAGLTNCSYSETGPGSNPRWSHIVPNASAEIIQAENIYMPPVADKTYPAGTVPTSSTLHIAGWVDTKRFSVWLETGLAEFGQVNYDTTNRTFAITSETGTPNYTLRLKNQTANVSVTATINGAAQTVTADSGGVATFAGASTANGQL
jgi:pimeloyl-ACP methyl ester carboxylesterase